MIQLAVSNLYAELICCSFILTVQTSRWSQFSDPTPSRNVSCVSWVRFIFILDLLSLKTCFSAADCKYSQCYVILCWTEIQDNTSLWISLVLSQREVYSQLDGPCLESSPWWPERRSAGWLPPCICSDPWQTEVWDSSETEIHKLTQMDRITDEHTKKRNINHDNYFI